MFLVKEPSYGASLLARMQEELPHCFSDSAIIYRSLQDMEKQGLVAAKWDIEGGRPRKWYNITPKGLLVLADFAEDIKCRRENFNFFLAHYEKIK